jgi:hypothetical protein
MLMEGSHRTIDPLSAHPAKQYLYRCFIHVDGGFGEW